jgi:hypothetical protein
MNAVGTQSTVSTDLAKFLWAERQQESGGNYKSVNSGSGALGAYQVMPSNLPGWEKQAGVKSENATEFLNDPSEQDAVATKILGGYYNKYGDAGAAAMWYSGQPDPRKTYGNPPVYKYVADVLALEKQAPGSGLPSTTAGTVSGSMSGTGSVEQASAGSALLGLFGITNLQDTAERIGLILLGGIMITIALIKMTGTDQKVIAAGKGLISAETGGAVG